MNYVDATMFDAKIKTNKEKTLSTVRLFPLYVLSLTLSTKQLIRPVLFSWVFTSTNCHMYICVSIVQLLSLTRSRSHLLSRSRSVVDVLRNIVCTYNSVAFFIYLFNAYSLVFVVVALNFIYFVSINFIDKDFTLRKFRIFRKIQLILKN